MYRLLAIASLICTARAIFNGIDTGIEQVPYQASIIRDKRGHVCGGSIISEELVLTAGHCVLSYTNYSVRVGSRFPNRGGTVHQVTAWSRHVGFHRGRRNIDSYHNDIALLKVTPRISFDSTKSAIEIYKISDPVNYGDAGVVAGWGADQTPDMKASPGLSSVNFTVIDSSECLDDFKYYGDGTEEAPKNSFCARDNLKNICPGDAGSAFVINGKQAGMLSWGWTNDYCVESRLPGVYVDVAKNYDWIARHAKVLTNYVG